MDGMGVLTFVNSHIPQQVLSLLDQNRLKVEDVDLFIFHQASKMALDSLNRRLGIESRSFSNLPKLGNTVSASIPIALKDAWTQGQLKGNRVLLCGFGVGLSWASSLLTLRPSSAPSA